MNKAKKVGAKDEERPLRITRARARALGSRLPPYSRPSVKNEPKNAALRANSKTKASDENSTSVVVPGGGDPQHKRKAVLTDVTNISINNASKFQARRVSKKQNTKPVSAVTFEVSLAQEDARVKLAEELSTIRMVESHDTIGAETVDGKVPEGQCVSNSIREHGKSSTMHSMQDSAKSDELKSSPNKGIDTICEKLGASNCLAVVDIDSGLKDPHVWSSYAPDIYANIRVTELERRPITDYMSKLQHDITPSMRGILIDWLVEVSEEYRLVPDTLYLTVNLIDRFLSSSFIPKQRLQLLGVTCMLIASKYEEICAPRVEEFCIITDSTYTKEEVLKMERAVLNTLHFHLSVPTTKTFLRRFINAAQSSYKVSGVELEFLANYLAELTLVEYSFLQFLPSLVAASAVFLARWTLNHSEHPWNPTLEHYTNYKASELETIVLAVADLQLNTKGCPLNAIREKYKQQKFKCVATMSPKPVQTLFRVQV